MFLVKRVPQTACKWPISASIACVSRFVLSWKNAADARSLKTAIFGGQSQPGLQERGRGTLPGCHLDTIFIKKLYTYLDIYRYSVYTYATFLLNHPYQIESNMSLLFMIFHIIGMSKTSPSLPACKHINAYMTLYDCIYMSERARIHFLDADPVPSHFEVRSSPGTFWPAVLTKVAELRKGGRLPSLYPISPCHFTSSLHHQ